jgi:hypothetical protein
MCALLYEQHALDLNFKSFCALEGNQAPSFEIHFCISFEGTSFSSKSGLMAPSATSTTTAVMGVCANRSALCVGGKEVSNSVSTSHLFVVFAVCSELDHSFFLFVDFSFSWWCEEY